MKILVTGGAGFIGSHVCDALIAADHAVVAVDNLLLGRVENVTHLAKSEKFRLVIGDVLDTDMLRTLFAENRFDAVFHLAANSDIARSFADPAIDLDNTFRTTYRVLAMMRQFGVEQIIFASTSAIFGAVPGRVREDYGPLMPESHYGAAKLASEAFLSSFSRCYGIQVWIARFPNVVGSRGTHGVIVDLINKLKKRSDQLEVLGDGEQNKPYVHVSDLVNALIFIWTTAKEAFNVFNVSAGGQTKVKTIAQEVIAVASPGASICYKGGARGWVGDVPIFDYDNAKILALGWAPSMSSDEAVKRAIREIYAERGT